jgi:Peptidase M16 inactive domain
LAVAQEPAIFTGSEVRIRDPDMPLVHFAVAYKGASWVDADSVPLMVAQSMLGAWDKNAGAGDNMASGAARRAAPVRCAVGSTSRSIMPPLVTSVVGGMDEGRTVLGSAVVQTQSSCLMTVWTQPSNATF